MSANIFSSRYRDELAYLRQLGGEFAAANPDLAGFLARSSNDPDVERLLEGFAFLSAKLHQRLDEELPEFAKGLLSLVWPQYLQPIPPLTIMRFEPKIESGGAIIHVPSGTQVAAVSRTRQRCVFQTAYDVTALPLEIIDADAESRSTSASMTLEFRVTGGATLKGVPFDAISLHILALRQPLLARTLYLWLCRHLRDIVVELEGGETISLPVDRLKRCGFGDDEAVIPYPKNGFSGYRILQEYFTLPQKFMFFRLTGLDCLAQMARGNTFKVNFQFSRPFSDEVRVETDTFALNATPAINLYPQEGQPISVSRSKSEFRVLPAGDASQTVHSITTVVGYRQGTGERIEYQPFYSFRHDLPGEESERLYYFQRTRTAIVGRGLDHFLSFVTHLNEAGWPSSETISLRLMCTSGTAAETLDIGSVSQTTSTTPGNLDFANIDQVQAEVQPPVSDNLMWRLIANLSRNFGSLVDAEALKTVIAAFDFRAIHDIQARQRLELKLNGIERFSARPTDVIAMGRAFRGREIELTLNEDNFGGEGEAFLFGSVVDEFLNAYASVNAVHRFKVTGSAQNSSFVWPPRQGEAAPY